MSVAKVLRLDEYRDRRQQRSSLSRVLSAWNEQRSALHDNLVEVLRLAGADRAAIVWIDEYGPGQVHPHLVVDLASDQPRRHFPEGPLHLAWQAGVPGTCDEVGDRSTPFGGAFAVALGSDGGRGWFLIADTTTTRDVLDDATREQILFLAGECSAIVLHRDLDADDTEQATRFPGWRILEDLDDRPGDAHDREIHERFMVGRIVTMYLDDDLVVPEYQRTEQVARVREELGLAASADSRELLAVLDAYERGELSSLATALVTAGASAERADHVAGAMEFYRLAFRVAAELADARVAFEAARLQGRVLRRRAMWGEAIELYRLASEVAVAIQAHDLVARAMVGVSVIQRERGNLPAARATLEETEAIANRSGDPEAIGLVHHDAMLLELVAGDRTQAIRRGWQALGSYQDPRSRTRCLAGVAGVLMEMGDHDAAEDAYRVVTAMSEEVYYLVYAYDALAYLAATQGDDVAFEARARECDRLGWETGPLSAKAEILYFRGLSYRELGRLGEAREWLSRAVDFCGKHGFARTLFLAEEALATLSSRSTPSIEPLPSAPPEVRDGLRAMREALVGAGVS